MGAGETGDVGPSFLILEAECVVAPLTPRQREWHSLGMRVMLEMDRNKENWALLHVMLFQEENMSTQAVYTEKRGGGTETSGGVMCSQNT